MTNDKCECHVAGDRGHHCLQTLFLLFKFVTNERNACKTRQDKTFIIIILQIQFFGTQLVIKR